MAVDFPHWNARGDAKTAIAGGICAAMVDKCLIGRRRLAYEAPFRAIWLAISMDEFDGDGDRF